MEFCDVCENMLNLITDKTDGDLKYMCKSCLTYKKVGAAFNPCVHKTNYGGNEKIFYEMFINEYTFIDPTLPRSKQIHCPNCNKQDSGKQQPLGPLGPSSIQKNETEVIYVRYNEADMKYIYLCCSCKSAWINPEYQKNQIILTEGIS
jgi:DNA-directed RNA polymerase subunit M/transcription elongation factor TFIIS